MVTAVYMRVSTNGQSVASQRQTIEKYLSAHGADDVAWFIDEGISGVVTDRPALGRLKSAVFRGEVQTVILFSLDRLSRNALEGLNLLCEWLAAGVRLIVVTLEMDFSGTVGRMVASLLLHVAELERGHIRERQAAGIAAARAAGQRWGGRKPGVGLKADPARVLELRQRGLSNREVAQALGVSTRTIQRHTKPSPAAYTAL